MPRYVRRVPAATVRHGGGFRSPLAADALQKMGYANVISKDGGVRDWRAKGYPRTAG